MDRDSVGSKVLILIAVPRTKLEKFERDISEKGWKVNIRELQSRLYVDTKVMNAEK